MPHSRHLTAGQQAAQRAAKESLTHRHTPLIIVVGGFGAGKTAVLQELARELSSGGARGRVIDAMDLVGFTAQEVASRILEEAKGNGHRVVFVDDLGFIVDSLPPNERRRFATEIWGDDKRNEISIVTSGLSASRVSELQVAIDEAPIHSPSIHEVCKLVLAILRDESSTPAVRPIAENDIHRALADLSPAIHTNLRFATMFASSIHTADLEAAISRAQETWMDQARSWVANEISRVAPAERRVLAHLAHTARPETVTRIAQGTHLSHQSTAATLGRLLDRGHIVKSEPAPDADRRKSWYRVHDPVMQLWFGEEHSKDSLNAIATVDRVISRQEMRKQTETGHGVELDFASHANALMADGEWRKAEPILRELLAEAVLDHGGDSSTVASLVQRILACRAGQSLADPLFRQYERGLASIERTQGATSVEYLRMKLDRAWHLIEVGNQSLAIDEFDDVMRLAAQATPPLGLIALEARRNRARALGELGRIDDAVAEFRETLERLQVEHPTAISDIRGCTNGLAWWLGEAGNPQEAAAMFRALAAQVTDDEWESLRYEESSAHWLGRSNGGDHGPTITLLVDVTHRAARHAEQKFRDIARRASLSALQWALNGSYGFIDALPMEQIDPEDFAREVAPRVARDPSPTEWHQHLLDVSTPQQLTALFAEIEFGGAPFEKEFKLMILAEIAERLSDGATPSIFSDLVDALDGNADALSTLPDRWRNAVQSTSG